MKFLATLFTTAACLASTAWANPFGQAYSQHEAGLYTRDTRTIALEIRDLYEELLEARGLEEDLFIQERDVEESYYSKRAGTPRPQPELTVITWIDPSKLARKQTMKASWEHFIRDWAERKFGRGVYVRIQDEPHRSQDPREHMTVDVNGKGYYHVYTDGGAPKEKHLP